MARVNAIRYKGGQVYWFICPGCKTSHAFYVGVRDHPTWQFNGNLQEPTFSPSLHNDGCDAFVIRGTIKFLKSCTHALTSKTIRLPHLKETENGTTNAKTRRRELLDRPRR